eukprot:305189_1
MASCQETQEIKKERSSNITKSRSNPSILHQQNVLKSPINTPKSRRQTCISKSILSKIGHPKDDITNQIECDEPRENTKDIPRENTTHYDRILRSANRIRRVRSSKQLSINTDVIQITVANGYNKTSDYVRIRILNGIN